MNLIYRLIRILLQSLRRESIGFFDPSVVTFRVLLNDLDLNMHMTNSRYLALMDLGRVDLLVRTGLGRFFITEKWQAVLGVAHVRFRRPLRLFQKYTLTTRIVGVDEKWSYIEQRFEADGHLVAYALVRGIFARQGKSIPVEDILEKLGLPKTLEPLSPVLQQWKDLDEAFKKET